MSYKSLQKKVQINNTLNEEIICFESNNQTIRGILTAPINSQADECFIFTHGWSGNRAGPSSLLTNLARNMAEEGYEVLRFDFAGRGESDGEGLQSNLLSMADDLTAAAKHLKKLNNKRKLSYLGLCSGGNVLVGSLNRLPEANRIVLLSMYPFSDGDAFSRDLKRFTYYLKIYWQKAFQAHTWKRLFKGDIRISSVLKVIFSPFTKKDANKKKEAAVHKNNQPKNQAAEFKARSKSAAKKESRTQNTEAPKEHLKGLHKNLPVHMIYGTADPDADAAIKYFKTYAEENKLPLKIETIQNADHNFTAQNWRKELTAKIIRGLGNRE